MAAHVLACESEERCSIEDDTMFEILNRACGEKNIGIVKTYFKQWGEHRRLATDLMADDFEASMWSGIMPDGHKIKGKDALAKYLEGVFGESPWVTIHKIQTGDFGHNEKGDMVYHSIHYDLTLNVGPYKGQRWSTTGNFSYTLRDGKIVKQLACINVPTTKNGVHVDWYPPAKEPNPNLGKSNIEAIKRAMTNTERSPKFDITWKPSWENTNSTDGFRFTRHAEDVMTSLSGVHSFLDYCHPDYTGEVFSGIVPGGANIEGLENLGEWMTSWSMAFKPNACVVHDFGASEDGEVVYFTADWDVVWNSGPYKGQNWKCTGISRKHMKDGKILRDYYILNMPFECNETQERG